MWFFRDIVFPIVLALLLLGSIVYVLNLVFKFFQLDIPILIGAGLILIWYYFGPIVYDWLITKIIVVPREGIRILYMPIQAIIEVFENLV